VHPVVRVAYACADVPLKVTVVEEWFHEDFHQCPVRAYGGVAGGGGGSERGVFFRSRSFFDLFRCAGGRGCGGAWSCMGIWDEVGHSRCDKGVAPEGKVWAELEEVAVGEY
jgi:hypothetical protein